MSEQQFLEKRIPVRAKKLERAKDKPVALMMNASFGIGDAAVILGSLDDCVPLFVQAPGTKGLSFSSEWQSRIGFYSGEKDKTAELTLECTVRKVSLLKKETKKKGDLVVLRFQVIADEIEGNRDSEAARIARKFLDEMARLGLPWYLAFGEGTGTQQMIPGTPNPKHRSKGAVDKPKPAEAPAEAPVEKPKGKKSEPASPGPEGQALVNMVDKAVKLAKAGGFTIDQLTGDDGVKAKALKRLVDSGTLKKSRKRAGGGKKIMVYELAGEGE